MTSPDDLRRLRELLAEAPRMLSTYWMPETVQGKTYKSELCTRILGALEDTKTGVDTGANP